MSLINNTLLKINEKIVKLKEKYTLYEFVPATNWKQSILSLHCKDHGAFSLTGLEARLGKSCPDCKIHNKEKLMENYLNINNLDRKKLMEKEFPNIDWSEVEPKEFLNLDHTIRPDCFEHGEFITTPRKLFSGDKCKWCDGVQNMEGEYYYSLSSEQFKKEKISIIYGRPTEEIHILENNKFLLTNGDGVPAIGDILKIKKNTNYIQHLKEVREPSCWNTILFKINIIDKSSKFQFSVVSNIKLNEQWLDWYKENLTINPDNHEVTQNFATNKIISIWFNTVFYNKQEDNLKDPFQYEIVWSFWSNSKRIESLYTNFKLANESKELILPEAINSKIYHILPQLKIKCYWSDTKWESTSNSVSLIREALLNSSCKCPICKGNIDKPVVDHEHTSRIGGTGRIRNNICSNCNVFIAKAENNCKRFGILLEELPEVLKNISDYFTEQQFNIIHYTDKPGKPTLQKSLANKILKYWDCLYPKKRKLKYPRSGIITKDWEDAIKALEEYEKNPAKPFTKNDYKLLLRKIEIYNSSVSVMNVSLPKTKKINMVLIPEYPKLKVITPEIQRIIDIV